MEQGDWITTGELARIVGCNRLTVRRACVAGEIAGAFRTANEWVIPRAAGLAWGERFRTRAANRQARALIAHVAGADVAEAVIPGRRRGAK